MVEMNLYHPRIPTPSNPACSWWCGLITYCIARLDVQLGTNVERSNVLAYESSSIPFLLRGREVLYTFHPAYIAHVLPAKEDKTRRSIFSNQYRVHAVEE